jgi:hypothetical protein
MKTTSNHQHDDQEIDALVLEFKRSQRSGALKFGAIVLMTLILAGLTIYGSMFVSQLIHSTLVGP